MSYKVHRWEGKKPMSINRYSHGISCPVFVGPLGRPKNPHVHPQSKPPAGTYSLRRKTSSVPPPETFPGIVPCLGKAHQVARYVPKFVLGGRSCWLLYICVVGRMPLHSVPSRLRVLSVTTPPPLPTSSVLGKSKRRYLLVEHYSHATNRLDVIDPWSPHGVQTPRKARGKAYTMYQDTCDCRGRWRGNEPTKKRVVAMHTYVHTGGSWWGRGGGSS